MSRTFSFRVTSGMDSAVRVMTTLRRKQFEVKEFSMKELENHNSLLQVTVEDNCANTGFERAVLYMKKLEDVYDVKEVC